MKQNDITFLLLRMKIHNTTSTLLYTKLKQYKDSSAHQTQTQYHNWNKGNNTRTKHISQETTNKYEEETKHFMEMVGNDWSGQGSKSHVLDRICCSYLCVCLLWIYLLSLSLSSLSVFIFLMYWIYQCRNQMFLNVVAFPYSNDCIMDCVLTFTLTPPILLPPTLLWSILRPISSSFDPVSLPPTHSFLLRHPPTLGVCIFVIDDGDWHNNRSYLSKSASNY